MKKRLLKKESFSNLLPCIFYGLICGVLTGAFIVLFKFIAKQSEEISRWVFENAKSSPLLIASVFVGLIAFALALYFLHKRMPEVKGGGIPRSEGVLRGLLSFNWLKVLIGTFIGSIIGFLCGVPVGAEGPAVLMGTAIGAAVLSFSKNKQVLNRYVCSGGAGAGFAVATGAPLSGILFTLEEVHKRFTLMLVLTVAVSVISASLTSTFLCDVFELERHLFHVHGVVDFVLSDVWCLLIAGVLIAFAVAVFDASIMFYNKFTKDHSKYFPSCLKLLFVFIITGILAFILVDAVYSGHDVIEALTENTLAIKTLLLLVVLRLIMMLFVANSGVTGGIFIPTLAIGALFGALIAKLLIFLGMDCSLYVSVVMLCMCAFIGGTLRAPLTATVLFVELTGQFSNLLYVALVVFIVNAITELIDITPFYDRVLKNMENHEHKGKTLHIRYFEAVVSDGAFVVGKVVREIMWPPSAVVLCVSRTQENGEVDDAIDKKIASNDRIILRARFYDKDELKEKLKTLVGDEFEIKDYKTLSSQI